MYMYGFSIDGYRGENTTETRNAHCYSEYVTCPSDMQNCNVFDIEQPQAFMQHRWLDDYGWL